MVKKIILILILGMWLFGIYYSSSMDADESGAKSGEIIRLSIEYVSEKTNDLGWTDIDKEDIPSMIDDLQRPFRKSAHAIVFGGLAMLMMIICAKAKINMLWKIVIALSSCLIYAMADEYHQLYVEGRTGQWSDVAIDMYGAIIGVSIYLVIYGIVVLSQKIKKKNIENEVVEIEE